MDVILEHDEIKNFILTDPEGATNLIIDMFNEEILDSAGLQINVIFFTFWSQQTTYFP